jgi:hypothetical protein
MSLFACERCDVIENTATSRYWDGCALCSQCDPAIGKWHGLFPRETVADRQARGLGTELREKA